MVLHVIFGTCLTPGTRKPQTDWGMEAEDAWVIITIVATCIARTP
jgi:hypothetical protein